MSNNLDENKIKKEYDFDVLYEQCNNHLLESDKKRDQILVLFTSITGLYVGNIDKLKNMPGFSIISIAMILMGLTFAFVVLEYRKWHIKYALACVVIQRLMFNKDEPINQKKITEILRSIVVPTTPKKFFKTTESLIFNLYVAINSINIYILEVSYNFDVINIYIFIILYFILLNYIYYNAIRKLCDKDKILSSSIWIINLFGREADI